MTQLKFDFAKDDLIDFVPKKLLSAFMKLDSSVDKVKWIKEQNLLIKKDKFKERGIEDDSDYFSLPEILEKIGENPVCYLTGDKINLLDSSSYSFDHIQPASRGGTKSLDNLGICTSQVNRAKGDNTLDEFIELCNKVVSRK